jgi:hypothetical protein
MRLHIRYLAVAGTVMEPVASPKLGVGGVQAAASALVDGTSVIQLANTTIALMARKGAAEKRALIEVNRILTGSLSMLYFYTYGYILAKAV